MYMTYTVTIERKAERTLSKIEARDRIRIETVIGELAHNPRPHGCTKLSGVAAYRVRVGNYRVVYTVADSVRVVNVTNVGHRRDIYKEA